MNGHYFSKENSIKISRTQNCYKNNDWKKKKTKQNKTNKKKTKQNKTNKQNKTGEKRNKWAPKTKEKWVRLKHSNNIEKKLKRKGKKKEWDNIEKDKRQEKKEKTNQNSMFVVVLGVVLSKTYKEQGSLFSFLFSPQFGEIEI